MTEMRACHDNLPQADAAVVGRHLLVEKNLEVDLPQPLRRPLSQQSVLETTARQRHPPFSDKPGHCQNSLHQSVVEACCNDTPCHTPSQIVQ